MSECGVPYPNEPDRLCSRPGTGAQANHRNHSTLYLIGYIDWPNESFVPPMETTKGRTRTNPEHVKALRTMATKVKQNATPKRAFYPTESTMVGRVALYFLKYLGEWIDLEELQHPTVAGSSAESRVGELVNHYGWDISRKDQKFKLNSDPRTSSVFK